MKANQGFRKLTYWEWVSGLVTLFKLNSNSTQTQTQTQTQTTYSIDLSKKSSLPG